MFDVERLKAGDILLSSDKKFPSKLIRLFTWSKYSHVMIYLGNYSFIHAESNGGVKRQNIERVCFSKISQACVVRVSDLKIAYQACEFAKIKVNTKYSKKEAVRTKLYLLNETRNRQFCSRLVAESYEKAGLKLVRNSSLCSPAEIFKSDKVQVVHNCIKEGTTEDLMIFRTFDTTNFFAKIQAKQFEKIRSITGIDIQNTENLLIQLMLHPEYDEEITKIHDEEYFYIIESLSYKDYHDDYKALVKFNPQNISKKDFIVEEIKSINKMKIEIKNTAKLYQKIENNFKLNFATLFKNYYEKELVSLDKRLTLCEKYKENLDLYN